jgi:hypothetical protein
MLFSSEVTPVDRCRAPTYRGPRIGVVAVYSERSIPVSRSKERRLTPQRDLLRTPTFLISDFMGDLKNFYDGMPDVMIGDVLG